MTPKPFHGQGVSVETGEVIEIAGHVTTTGRKHQRKQRRHRMFGLADLERIADLELTQQEQRVFWTIARALTRDSGSVARIATSEIAEKTGMHKSNVSTTLASLRRRNIVSRERTGVWLVSPWIIYAGSAEDWEAATADAPEPEWSRS